MHTLRPLAERGFGRKTTAVLDERGAPVRAPDGRLVYTRFMGTPDDFKALRNAWGDYANRHYALAGLSLRIDMRSYAACGIDMVPGKHLGPALSALRARGYSSKTITEFARSEAAREVLLRANPEIAVDLTAATHATFTRADLARTIDTFVSSPDVFQATLAAAETSPQLVDLTGAEGASPRYATERQIVLEQGVINGARALAGRAHPAPSAAEVRDAIAATEADLAGASGAPVRLSGQQLAALDALTQPTALTAVVGLAGTGKSTVLAAANRGWRSAGCTVHGAALAGIATRGLQSASGIPSRTVASWLAAWDAGTHLLSRGDVFVLDEAGMVGTSDMARIVAEVERAGAKLVVVGDPEQLQPIAAGAPFRAITDTVGHVTLSDIRRQVEPAMRAATTAFARGDMAAGLAPYLAAGAVHTVETTDDAIGDMVEAYVAGMDRAGTQNAVATDVFRDRRGIDRPASERERAATALATRRLLVSDAWNRLEDAAALAFARSARTVHGADVVRIRSDLVGVGVLPVVAKRVAMRTAHLMVQRLSPASIAHALVPRRHPLASTLWATLRGVASRAYSGVATARPRGPQVAPLPAGTPVAGPDLRNWSHTQLSADATHYRLSFAYHKQAVRFAAEAGFAFDAASRTWLRPLDAPQLADPGYFEEYRCVEWRGLHSAEAAARQRAPGCQGRRTRRQARLGTAGGVFRDRGAVPVQRGRADRGAAGHRRHHCAGPAQVRSPSRGLTPPRHCRDD
jgi:hypothetical protein